MQTDDFDPFAPMFGQPDAVELTQADNDTIDNWVRYKHVIPVRVGKRRMFSFQDLLTIDLIHMLQRNFRAEIHVSAHIAKDAAKQYLDLIEDDREDIQRGRAWHSPMRREDTHVSLTRDQDGTLRAVERGDRNEDSVMVVLPVRLIGRRLLANVEKWANQ